MSCSKIYRSNICFYYNNQLSLFSGRRAFGIMKLKKLYTIIFLLIVIVVEEFIILQAIKKPATVFKYDTASSVESFSKTIPAVLPKVEPTKSFTVIVLPDTQYYSKSYPEIFCAQTEWIVAHKKELNIVFVSQLGDIVNDGAENMAEWAVASRCMGKLDGVVPYSVIPGNHDADKQSIKESGFSAYDATFPVSRFQKYPWYRGHFDKNRNNYEIVNANGMKIMFLNLEIEPSNEALSWAESIVKANKDIYTIVTTHKYLNVNESKPEDNLVFSKNGNTGRGIWDKLVFKNCSIKAVLNGHFHGENHISTKNSCRQDVHQIVQDYQDFRNGGNGWLRIYQFIPSEKKIEVYTYSPYLGEMEVNESGRFSLSTE